MNGRAETSTEVVQEDRDSNNVIEIGGRGVGGVGDFPVSRLMLQLQVQELAQEGVPPGCLKEYGAGKKGFYHDIDSRQGHRHVKVKNHLLMWRENLEVNQIKQELGVSKIYNADQSGIFLIRVLVKDNDQ
ncbi:hypothetical protein P3T76_005213 [Phytophthora citrophthora]|uniref:Uncharacterized protein n=1 Tax=Phytophthora citrophthora TaxID=4793 RepID=A0AAD9GSC8_9STRA|nr:hypothetical protein P3T76_005213 [Phytophthora citrophthora]